MSVVVPERVEVFFDLSATGGDFFTLNDPIKGRLDNAQYPIGGEVATDITGFLTEYSISRGRSRELDEIYVGTCYLRLNNYDGRFSLDSFSPTDVITYDDEPVTFDDEPIISAMAPYGTGNITPGKRIRVQSVGVTVFDGIIQSWDLEYDSDLSAVVAVVAEDSLGQLGRRRFNDWTTTASQTPGERFDAVLDRPEVDWGANRDIDDGGSSLQSDNVSHGSNVLNYCQLIAKSDLGRLFADRQGVLTYRDRFNLVSPTVTLTLTDDADLDGGVDFKSVSPSAGSDLLFSDVSVDREGGIAQTVSDATSRNEHGIRRLDLNGILVDTDLQSADLANYLLGIYKAPQERFNDLVVGLEALTPALQSAVNTLDLAQVVRVTWTPRGSSFPTTSLHVVEGVSHSTSRQSPHYVTLRLSPVFQAETFVLDSDSLGVLNSGVLAF